MIENLNDINFDDLKFDEIKSKIKCIEKNYFDIKPQVNVEEIIQLLYKDHRKSVQKLSVSLQSFIEKTNKEIERVNNMYFFDKGFISNGYVSGTDEVGRGPLAGPVVGAAVVLDLNKSNSKDIILGINDSKKLSAKLREELSSIIKEKSVSYKIVEIENTIIDEKGIGWCNNEVLKQSTLNLNLQPNLVLSDGYAIKNINIKNQYVIKGDSKSASIACASIIAKVYRDNVMDNYAMNYPQYGFEKNAGYGTAEHIEALKKFGPCKIHRMSFLKNIL
ncbi:MAG: ribonuclease HII [Clostridium lundense]|nr:ribonuclease HII [Clostridium lundense]